MSREEDLHFNGIHVKCRPVQVGKTRGDGTHRRCPKAGTVERSHGHDFDGPLWSAGCGCREVAA